MQCRQCGTEIAGKALICYKCGAATTDPVHQPPVPAPRRSRASFLVTFVALVLLVFCYLIVPSVAAMLYAESVGKRLAIGWSMGTIVSALGVYLSLKLDLPTGATIVCTFGVALALMAAVRPLFLRAVGADLR